MSSLSKTQVDQLGDRLRKGNISDDDLRLLDAYRESFAAAYEEVVTTIRTATGLEQLEPAGRWKTNISIIAKLVRESTMRLSRMQDIAGCRVVVEDTLKQDWVVERLIRVCQAAKVYDRRKQPSHGYRAVHVIATAQERLIEVQVRTELQHLWAQLSEELSDLFDPSIKYGGGDSDIRELLSALSDAVSALEVWELRVGAEGLDEARRFWKQKQHERLRDMIGHIRNLKTKRGI